jgi:hypothetical protein
MTTRCLEIEKLRENSSQATCFFLNQNWKSKGIRSPPDLIQSLAERGKRFPRRRSDTNGMDHCAIERKSR